MKRDVDLEVWMNQKVFPVFFQEASQGFFPYMPAAAAVATHLAMFSPLLEKLQTTSISLVVFQLVF